MSLTPEENRLPKEESKVPEAAEESTIFGASPIRDEEKKPAKTGKHKMLKTALSLLLALLLLGGGTLAVIKLVPEKDNGDATSSGTGTLWVTDIDREKVKSVRIVREKGESTYLTTVKESDSSDGDPTVTWTIEGIDPTLTETTSISLLMDTVLSLSANREIALEQGADYGFAKPTYKTEIKGYNSANDVTLLIGGRSPSDSGYYATTDGGQTVYLISTADADEFATPDEELAVSSIVTAATSEDTNNEYYTDGALSYFDSITLTRKGEQTIVITPNQNENLAKYVPYVMSKPAQRYAAEDAVEEMMNIAKTGLSADAAYVYAPTAADKKTFGLTSPDFALTLKFDGKTVGIKAAKQLTGDYAVMLDGNDKIIFKVTADSFPFAEKELTEFLGTTVFVEMLAELSKITVESQGKTYVFDITYDEEADPQFAIKANGKDITADYFQTYYQHIVVLRPNETTFDAVKGTPDYSIKAEYADGSGTRTMKLIKHTDRRYYVETDGTPVGFISTTYAQNLMDYVIKVANNEAVPEL